MGLDFEVNSADLDEDAETARCDSERPENLAMRLATMKTAAVARAHPGALVLGADTVVGLAGGSLGKPANHTDALQMLHQLNGKNHEVVTSTVLGRGTSTWSATISARVTMRRNTNEALEKYANDLEPLDKAGAYAVQGLGGQLVESVSGCFLAVVGLPVCAVGVILRKAGFRITDDPVSLCRRLANQQQVISGNMPGYSVGPHPAEDEIGSKIRFLSERS
jgi:septum formation protein